MGGGGRGSCGGGAGRGAKTCSPSLRPSLRVYAFRRRDRRIRGPDPPTISSAPPRHTVFFFLFSFFQALVVNPNFNLRLSQNLSPTNLFLARHAPSLSPPPLPLRQYLHDATAGALFLFDRKVVRFFRKDSHNWQKKKDGKTVRETHEKLKVGNVELLNCYYAHAAEDDRFQRRCYWLLNSDEGVVLVHYLKVRQCKV